MEGSIKQDPIYVKFILKILSYTSPLPLPFPPLTSRAFSLLYMVYYFKRFLRRAMHIFFESGYVYFVLVFSYSWINSGEKKSLGLSKIVKNLIEEYKSIFEEKKIWNPTNMSNVI